MHRIRNPAYRFTCTEGSNPSLSASKSMFMALSRFFCNWHTIKHINILLHALRTNAISCVFQQRNLACFANRSPNHPSLMDKEPRDKMPKNKRDINMSRISACFISFGILFLMTACSSTNTSLRAKEKQYSQEQINESFNTLTRCTDLAKNAKIKANCFLDFYYRTDEILIDSDPDKVPSLNAARKFYTLYTNIAIGKTDQRLESSEVLKVTTELKAELSRSREDARRQSNMEFAADQQRRMQMMQEAARLLSTPQPKTLTCNPQPNGVGTYCVEN
jgi:hypothetical protein